MKKKLLLLTMAVFAAVGMWAQTYYVAGDGAAGNSWCDGKYWTVDGSPMDMTQNPPSVTFSGVEAGTYAFKVTNGSTTWYGGEYVAEECKVPGVTAPSGGNIGFTIGGTADITISFDGTNIRLSSSIGFGELVISMYTVVGDAGLCGEQDEPAAVANDMVQNGNVWTKTYTGIAAGEYKYKVVGNHSYSAYEYPGSYQDKTVTVAEDNSTVTITFDPAAADDDPEKLSAVPTGPSSINSISDGIDLSAVNGTIRCSAENFVIYNPAGLNVTAQNGNLKGLYIVKYNGKAAAILVK
ncbi:MAG: hypothetical protein FWF54_11340 [Candidatus Azobacteroides sp.]|nr:hypothetical protein [Candidatus Azobacteroides sp.]